MGGSSKKVTVGYKYYLGMHMILCHGPVDLVKWFKVDGRTAWQGITTGGRVDVNAASLFGGEEREGGISGAVDIEMGKATQTRNGYLQARLGNDIPAFRGVVGAVLRQCYLGMNPYLKAWSFRAQRIHTRQDGVPQWYDAKSEIGKVDSVLVSTTSSGWEYVQLAEQADPGYENLTPPSSGWSAGTSPFGSGSWTWPGQPARNTNWSQASVLWLRRQITVDPASVIVARVRAENGCVLFLNGNIFGEANRENIQLMSGEVFDFTLPPGNHTLHVKAFDEVPTQGDTYISLEILSINHKDMNPAHIIRECLTDPDWGMGYQDSDIDDASFISAADTLWDERMGISLLWDRQIPLESFIGEIVKHIDAALYVSRTTGKFVLKLIRKDYNEESLITLDESNVLKVSDPTKPTFGELNNSVTVNYWDADTGKDASVTVTDTAMVQMQGAVINTTVQYPGFTNPTIATLVAQRDLRSLSSPLLSCTIYADQTAKDFNIGDVFKFTWPRWNIEDLVMRVTGIAFGDGKTNQVRITCTQDVFDIPSVSVVSDPGEGWVDPTSPPSAAIRRLAFEAPYFELVQAQGQLDVDDRLSVQPEIGYLMAAAGRPGDAINARAWIDNGSGYEDSFTLDFCPTASLKTAVGKMDTMLEAETFTDADLITVGTFLQIGSELCRVDSVDEVTGEIIVGRGVLDTTPQNHDSGEIIYFWDAYSAADVVEYVDGEVLDVKLTPVTGQGQLDLFNAPSDTVVMMSRASRPYPPADFKINGAYFPTLVDCTADISLSWVSRNRTQQTGGTLLDFTDAGVTAEAGTTYTVRARDTANLSSVIYNATGISALTHTIPANSLTSVPSVQLELLSVRSGLESYMAQSHVIETGVSLWTPADLTTPPTLWVSDASAITEVSGAVSQVNDLSANGYNLTQGSSSARPVAVAGALNGRRVLRFDGSNDRLLGPTGAAQNVLSGVGEAWSISVVKSSTTSSGNRYYFSITESASSNNAHYLDVISSTTGGTFTNRPGIGGRRLAGTSYSEVRSATGVGTNWHMALKRLKYASATGIINVNGNSDESSAMSNMTSGVTSTATRSVFKFGGDDNNFHNGDIAELIFGVGTLTTDEIDKLFGYLAHKWGLASELPSGHPYKANPPTN